MSEPVTLRPATPDDAQAIADLVGLSFEGYRSFAGSDWRPPDPAGPANLLGLEARLRSPDHWALVAREPDGRHVGHAAFLPARTPVGHAGDGPAPRDGPTVPGVAHLWQLFAHPDRWGTGLARDLLAAAVAAARDERGATQMRLFTPAGQARARAFYARERFEQVGGERMSSAVGLPMVELVRAL